MYFFCCSLLISPFVASVCFSSACSPCAAPPPLLLLLLSSLLFSESLCVISSVASSCCCCCCCCYCCCCCRRCCCCAAAASAASAVVVTSSLSSSFHKPSLSTCGPKLQIQARFTVLYCRRPPFFASIAGYTVNDFSNHSLYLKHQDQQTQSWLSSTVCFTRVDACSISNLSAATSSSADSSSLLSTFYFIRIDGCTINELLAAIFA